MILAKVKGPEDLKKLKISELMSLSGEVRDRMIDIVSNTGGHLGSSLGTVELTIALHYVFDSPVDKIIWDVGHQAYAHKILTGRNDNIETIRKEKGLSGFPRRSESVHDIFGAGHASTSISAALGVRVASSLEGRDERVIAVIGDGSMTGGLAYEGLNNLRSNLNAARNMIIILNDNGMSISPNVGGLSSSLSLKCSGSFYTKLRKAMKHVLSDRTVEFIKKLKHVLKNIILPGEFFESLCLRYLGPIDGHNIENLIGVLSNLKNNRQDLPVLLHVRTQKGRGYKYAETSPVAYHGVPSFDSRVGVVSRADNEKASFTDIFGKTMCELAEMNDRVVAVTAAMTTGTGLAEFSKRNPDRFFDAGIAEEHAVTFAAGMATEGFKPVVAIYSTFLQRAFDQVIHDVCLQKLPVVFCLDRAGPVGEDGPTHHGNFDLSFLRMIPEIIVMAPSDGRELRNMLFSAIRYEKPVAIRYPRDTVPVKDIYCEFNYIPPGESRELFRGDIVGSKLKVLFLSYGLTGRIGLDVAKFLAAEGISVEAIDVRFIKPIPSEVVDAIKRSDLVFTLEENTRSGGAGSAILEHLTVADKSALHKVNVLGIRDSFVEHGSREKLLELCGLNFNSVLKQVMSQIIKELSSRKAISEDTKSRYMKFSKDFSFYEKRAN